MKKKIFILVSILFSILFISSFCFAASPTPNTMENLGNDVKNAAGNVGNDVKNAAGNAGNTVKNGAQNLGNDVKNGIRNGENAIENTAKDITNNNGNTDGYTATRTATSNPTNSGNAVWTWIILAVIAVVIIGLIWYYAAKNSQNKNDR